MRKFLRCKKNAGSDRAAKLWFSDDRKEAVKLDRYIVWLDFDAEEERRTWDSVKDQVLAEWIQQHPGTRPGAWWKFEAPGPRQRVPNKPINWGVLVPDYCFGVAVIGEPAVYESQAAFLRRHGLLDASETQCDFRPELITINKLTDLLSLVGGIVN